MPSLHAGQRTMSLAKLQRLFQPAEGWSWEKEAEWLHANHPRRMARLRHLIEAEGIEEPIRLCEGGGECPSEDPACHVVDGHHRVVIAAEFGMERVPVADAWDGSDWIAYMDDRLDDGPAPAVQDSTEAPHA